MARSAADAFKALPNSTPDKPNAPSGPARPMGIESLARTRKRGNPRLGDPSAQDGPGPDGAFHEDRAILLPFFGPALGSSQIEARRAKAQTKKSGLPALGDKP